MARSSLYCRLRNCSLTLVLMVFFLLSAGGQLITGRHTYNEERRHHGLPEIHSVSEYFTSAHFQSTLFENWESEFLQMALFVFLTAFFIQKGSSESNPPPEEEEQQDKFPRRYFKYRPVLRKFYENSLALSLTLFFLLSFAGHAGGSLKLINEERVHEGVKTLQGLEILSDSEFWFESFQNWQSEFFSMAILVVLSIFLRQKGSAQSKEVDAPHSKTGN